MSSYSIRGGWRRAHLRDSRHLAKSFRDVARCAHEVGEVLKAERFERKAVEYEELARRPSKEQEGD
jgi:hypothetical protein